MPVFRGVKTLYRVKRELCGKRENLFVSGIQ